MPLSNDVTALPTVILSACEGLVIGVTVIVVSLPSASTIGLAPSKVDRLFFAPSNSVLSTVASKLDPKNFPNFLSFGSTG